MADKPDKKAGKDGGKPTGRRLGAASLKATRLQLAIGFAVIVAVAIAVAISAAHSASSPKPAGSAPQSAASPAPASPGPGAPTPASPAPAAPAMAQVPAAPAASSAKPAAYPNAAPPDPDPGSRFASNISEPVLMARLREAGQNDPALAVELARAGNRRFPDSQDAPERHSILIHALVAEGKGNEARGEAEYMVNHYVDSTWVRQVEQFTGAHRHRNVVVTDGGQIQFR